jgi:hypothetical protein
MQTCHCQVPLRYDANFLSRHPFPQVKQIKLGDKIIKFLFNKIILDFYCLDSMAIESNFLMFIV